MKKINHLLMVLPVVVAVIQTTILFIGCEKREQRASEMPECGYHIGTPSSAHGALLELERERHLETFEDSIHYYEDGY